VKHYIVAGVLVVVVTALLILGLTALDLVPELASAEGELVDQMFTAQLYVIAFFFSLVLVLMLYSVFVFRRRPDDDSDGPHVTGSTTLEFAWTVVPLIIVLVFGIWGAGQLTEITARAPDELVVEITGFQFGWRFEYPEYGVTSSDLYLPVNRQVLLKLTSTDVIHSFWVPEFRIKQDAVPGMWTNLRVTATETGDYRVRCAELCGYAHSAMYAPVIAVQPEEFEAWLDGQVVEVEAPEDMTPAERGAAVVAEQGCGSCHSLDGSEPVGPTWLGLFGSERLLEDGSTVLADELYLRNSILKPAEQGAANFPLIMPVYEGVLTDEDVDAIIEYIKTLSE
jgi:cytochrome c oxidase subunit 2